MLPLAGGNSCGGALERVAWATLRRCSREDGAHREGIETIVVYLKSCVLWLWVGGGEVVGGLFGGGDARDRVHAGSIAYTARQGRSW